MSYHGKQYATVEKVCACGCGQKFYPVPKYHPKSQGGGKWSPAYIRGHNPVSKSKLNTDVPWNKGLTKEHPSVAKICFQKGHPAYNDWSKVNEKLKTDPEFKARWLESKKGHWAWNKGTGKDDVTYIVNLLVQQIYERDNYACQNCGKVGKNTAKTRSLHCHHIVPIMVRPELILEPSNLITLCPKCHVHAHIGKLPHLIKTE